MRLENTNNNEIKQLIKHSKRIAVIPCKKRGSDALYAGIGLFQMLKGFGKDVDLLYTGGVPDNASEIIFQSEIVTDFDTRYLEVSIDYSDTNASKVHYSNEDNQVFKIKIGPIEKEYDLSRVVPSIVGFDYDLVFILGAEDFEGLGHEFKGVMNDLSLATTISLDNSMSNKRYASLNIVDTNFDNLSLLVYSYAPYWDLLPNIPSAKAILLGISPQGNERLPSVQ